MGPCLPGVGEGLPNSGSEVVRRWLGGGLGWLGGGSEVARRWLGGGSEVVQRWFRSGSEVARAGACKVLRPSCAVRCLRFGKPARTSGIKRGVCYKSGKVLPICCHLPPCKVLRPSWLRCQMSTFWQTSKDFRHVTRKMLWQLLRVVVASSCAVCSWRQTLPSMQQTSPLQTRRLPGPLRKRAKKSKKKSKDKEDTKKCPRCNKSKPQSEFNEDRQTASAASTTRDHC